MLRCNVWYVASWPVHSATCDMTLVLSLSGAGRGGRGVCRQAVEAAHLRDRGQALGDCKELLGGPPGWSWADLPTSVAVCVRLSHAVQRLCPIPLYMSVHKLLVLNDIIIMLLCICPFCDRMHWGGAFSGHYTIAGVSGFVPGLSVHRHKV